jgi:predicted MPP superfamily phosphohydrolase
MWVRVLIGIMLIGIAIIALWHGIIIRNYTDMSAKITADIRLVVITDLHSSIYGKEQKGLINMIVKQDPDLILLAGDIADDKVAHTGTKLLLQAIGKKYPCFYVTGNHEFWSGEIDSIRAMIRSYGVTILAGDSKIISIRSQKLRICGIDDPDRYLQADATPDWQTQYLSCNDTAGDEVYSILLSHRPEFTDLYAESNFDLVVSGHAHGGQVRIPGLINGLYVPQQGWFPRYAGGKYELKHTNLIISRGLSKNLRLPRVFNPPELVIIDLKPKD